MELYLLDNHLLNPKFGGGGWIHVSRVVDFLRKELEIVLVPRSSTLLYNDDEVETKVKELESRGIKVVDSYWEARKKLKNEINKLDRILPYRMSAKYSRILHLSNVNLYEPDHLGFDIFYLRSKSYAFVIQAPIYYENSIDYLFRLLKFYKINWRTGKGFHTRFLYNELVAKRMKAFIVKRPPRLIGAVSRGLLEWSGLKGEVLLPGNAIERDLLDYRCKGKEDYVMFWGMLNSDKGALELLNIVSRLRKRTKLLVAGRFIDKYYEKKFWKKVKSLNLDVEYLGFIDNRRSLPEIASKAKLLIYPSHVDGFSLVILESLALGTPVVAYSIPPIRSVYESLPGVKLVKEFDVEGMAKASDEFLGMSEKELCDVMNDEKLLEFLELHSSWDNVAREHLRLIKKAFGE